MILAFSTAPEYVVCNISSAFNPELKFGFKDGQYQRAGADIVC